MKNKTVQGFNNELHGVRMQSLYLGLINNRDSKIGDTRHKGKVLNGYFKIMNICGLSVA